MSNDSGSFLREWTINFVRNKDVITKKILNIENEKNGFDLYVKYKDKEQYFIIKANIEDIDSIIRRLDKENHFSVVTLNSQSNLDIIAKNWHKLTDLKLLSIIFVNPFSSLDKKWIIFPYTHHRICEETSLKTGLKSMFEMVDPINEEQLLQRIKAS